MRDQAVNGSCIVVGGGLIGMLTARELAAGGLRVHVLDRGALGQEASWAGGGILSPLYPWRYADAVNRLASWGQPRYAALAEALMRESGVDPQWTPSGMLVLDPGDEADAKGWAARFGVTLEPVGEAPCRSLEPALQAPLHQGLWMPDVAQVRNPRLVQALRGSLEPLRITFEEHMPVDDLVIRSGAVRGVRAGGRERLADAVVVAGGAWSPQLLGKAGPALAVEPVRGQMLVFRAEPGLVRHIVLQGGRYLIPRRDGRVLVGSTLERVGFDKSTTEGARQSLWESAVTMVPALGGFPVERHWSGLRPGSPEGVPAICESPDINNLYINAGHFRNGVVLGPASARLLADLVLGREPIVDPAPYRYPFEAPDD